MTSKNPWIRLARACVLLVFCAGAVLLAADVWNGIRRNGPVKAEAITLSKAIESDVRRGIDSGLLGMRYQHQLTAIMPKILGLQSKEIDELSKAYAEMPLGSHENWKIFAGLLQKAGESIKKE